MLQQLKEIMEYWKASIYEQQEDETDLIACMLRLIGQPPLRILEIGCGGAKLSASLAQAGHEVTGMDCNAAMLHFARQKAEKLPNLHLHQADALLASWGCGYDVVLLGTNLMCNLLTEWDYKQAQKQLIQRAAEALRPGGKLIVDFDCPDSLSPYGAGQPERMIFSGCDDRGVSGRYYVRGEAANEKKRLVRSRCRTEIIPAQGTPFQLTQEQTKHFPTLTEICAWLYREGFTIELLHGGHHGEPFDLQHRRAVIVARKE